MQYKRGKSWAMNWLVVITMLLAPFVPNASFTSSPSSATSSALGAGGAGDGTAANQKATGTEGRNGNGGFNLFDPQSAQAQAQTVSPTPVGNYPPPAYRVGVPTSVPTLAAIPDTNYEDQAISGTLTTLQAQVNALLPVPLVANTALVSSRTGGRVVSQDGGLTVGILPGTVALTDTINVQIVRATYPQGDPRATRNGYPLAYTYQLSATSASTGQPITRFGKNVILVWNTTASVLTSAGVLGFPLRAYTYDDQNGSWQEELSRWNNVTKQLVVSTPHFSTHAVSNSFDKVNNYLPSVKNFEVDLQSGAATVQYPINLPPAPGGFAPKVSLSYSSGNVDRVDVTNQGASPVGWGWSLSGSYIAATQHTFFPGGAGGAGYYPWTANIVSEGASGDLTKGQDGYWHTSIESFARIKYNPPTGGSRTNDSWEAWSKDGTHYVFDLNALSQDDYNRPPQLTTYKWLLRTATDSRGNTITYLYKYESSNGTLLDSPITNDRTRATYPYRIEYGGTDPARGNRSKVRIEFSLSQAGARQDISDNDLKSLFYQSYYITGIVVKRLQQDPNNPPGQDAEGYITLRQYQFNQDFTTISLPDSQNPPQNYPHLALTGIIQKAANGQQLPTTSFDYVSSSVCPANGPTRFDQGHLCFAYNGYGGAVGYYYDAAGGEINQAYRRVRAKRVRDGLSLDTSGPHNVVYRYASHGASTNVHELSTDVSVGAKEPLRTENSEFRGFAWVEEQDPMGRVTDYYFNQDDRLKGKEWRTQTGKETTLSDGLDTAPTATPNPNWTVGGSVQSATDPKDSTNNVWQVNPGPSQSPSSIERTSSVRDGSDVAMRVMMKDAGSCSPTAGCTYNTVSTWKLTSDQSYADGNKDYWGLKIERKYNNSAGAYQYEATAIWGLHNGSNGSFLQGTRDLSDVDNGLIPRRQMPIAENQWYWLKLHTSPDGRFALQLYRPYGIYDSSQDFIILKSGDSALDNQGNNSAVPLFPVGQTWRLRQDVVAPSNAASNFYVLDDAYSEQRTVYSQSDSVYAVNSIPAEPYNHSHTSPFVGSNNTDGMNIWFMPLTESWSAQYGKGTVGGQTVQGLNKRSHQVFGYDAYGNRSRVEDYGDVDVAGDDRSTLTSYAVADNLSGQGPGQGQYIVDRAGQTDSYRGIQGTAGSVLMARMLLYYDNQTTPASIPAPPSGRGDLTKQEQVGVDANGNVTAARSAQQFGYLDAQGNYDYGNRTLTTDPNGNRSSTTYDGYYHAFPVQVTGANGRSEYTSYDYTLDVPSSTTDMNNLVTRFSYDPFGRPASSWAEGFGSAANPNDRYLFSDINQVSVTPPFYISYQRRVGDPAGTQTAWQTRWFDGRGRTVQDVSPKDMASNTVILVDSTYTLTGQLASSTLPYETAGGANPTATVAPVAGKPSVSKYYDMLGRTTMAVNPDNTATLNNYDWLLWSMSKDESGVHEKWQHSDVQGRMDLTMERDTSTNPVGIMQVQYSYDTLDRLLVTVRDPGGPNQTAATMQYDDLGRKRGMSDPDMGQWQYEYDAAGNITVQRDALYIADPTRYADHQLYFQYDQMNRMTAKYYGAAHRSAGTADVRFYYDNTYLGDADAGSSGSWGKLRAAEVTVQGQGESKANGHTYSYEARGLLTQEVVTTTYTTRMTQWTTPMTWVGGLRV